MWHPTSRIDQMEKHVAEDDKKQQQQKDWKCDDDAAGNVDSGFLSGGNLQISEEISDLGLQSHQEGRQEEGEQRVAPGTTSSSSSATIEEESMRAIDSGLDLESESHLSEGLSQLSLKHISLNRLDSKPSESIPKLTPVTGNPVLNNTKLKRDELLQQQQGDSGSYDERAIANEEPWQLYYYYYAQDDDGDTQLHIAIMQGFVEAAIWLINKVPNPCLLDTLNDDWQSPLHLAVLTHEPMIVRRLILAGANPSVRNFRGNTALHLACASGDLACAKALTDPLSLKEKKQLTPEKKVPVLPQDLEQSNYNGEVCLHVATVNGHVDVVRLLLHHGADLRMKEGLAGYTALHLAVERECRPVFDFLLHECQRASCLDEQTYRGRTAYQLTLDINSDFAKEARRELVRCGATPEPLPESDSESNSDSSEDEDMTRLSRSKDYLLTINAVGVTV